MNHLIFKVFHLFIYFHLLPFDYPFVARQIPLFVPEELMNFIWEKLDIFKHIPQMLRVNRHVARRTVVPSVSEGVWRVGSSLTANPRSILVQVGCSHLINIMPKYINALILNKIDKSDWETQHSFLLVGLREIINEVCVEKRLYNACDKGSPNHSFPVKNPVYCK